MSSIKLKEDEVYFVITTEDADALPLSGLIYRDTVCLDQYDWTCADMQRLYRESDCSTLTEVYAVLGQDRSQRISLHRTLKVDAQGFEDEWNIFNPTQKPQELTLTLEVRARLIDLFSMRGATDPGADVEIFSSDEGFSIFSRTGEDGVTYKATITAPSLESGTDYRVSLGPKQRDILKVRVDIESSEHKPTSFPPLPSYEHWRKPFDGLLDRQAHRPGLKHAVDDLRSLVIRTESGAYPAAGMPIFVNLFGRDALIACMMISDWQPDVLKTVLEFLAKRQGETLDPFREEEPGKILHEIRRGELSRTNKIPFGRYYGSVDSTPLFLMAAADYARVTGDNYFIKSIKPNLNRALDWMLDKLNDKSGLATFQASGSGLAIQSWKDSGNSMLDEHGQPAEQPIAVAEVQGYCFAALHAMAELLTDTEPEKSAELLKRATELQKVFQEKFWLEDMTTYAMALDANETPLRVLSSDPGHLLWTGIVSEEFARPLVKTMMSDDLWSGWGLRTLGASEVAYNPVSYHNGSVWPHDTALFGMGLAKYGFVEETRAVASALLDLADASPHHRIPELISGYSREAFENPVSYTHANSPQAWAAAGLIRMASYLDPGCVGSV